MDKDSPAYVPSLFSFTESSMKRRAKQALVRWQAVKRRCKDDESAATEMSETEESVAVSMKDIDSMIITDTDRSIACQTDLTLKDISDMESDNHQMKEEPTIIQEQNGGYPHKQQLENNSKLLNFYTGFNCFTIFMAIFEFLVKGIVHSGHHKLSAFNCYLMTLMKLRLNLSHYDLAFCFNVSVPTVSRILSRWIFMMDNKMNDTLIKWPSREALQKTMPFCFCVRYGLRVVAIIDCFELFIEKPSNLLAKSCTWSRYKHYNTAKYLISITPQGVISFVS